MPTLRDSIFLQLAAGIQRKSVTSASRYAATYRIMGKPPAPTKFDRHPWSVEMLDTDLSWVGPKAAQMGYTETALNRAFYFIDIKKSDVLYLLPKKNPDATDFSKGRFDAALELSPHLQKLFSNTRNVGHKQAGSVNLYLRGTRSRSGVKSLPVSLLVMDELDEMIQANIPQAEERLSGQEEKQTIKISTPTVPDFGIDAAFQSTTQEHFVFRCPSCSKWTELEFPGSLIITTDDPNNHKALLKSHLICPICKNILPHESKADWLKTGRWQPTTNFDSNVRGFWIPQLYSSTMAPWEIAKVALIGQTKPEVEQEYWNSKGGKAHVVAGARITDGMINECIGSHDSRDPYRGGRVVTMGVDVGYKWLHFEIDEWFFPNGLSNDLNSTAVCKVLTFGKVEKFEDLYPKMREYQIQGCVIDANPENRKAYEMAGKFEGFVWLCYYGKMNKNAVKVNEAEKTVMVGRTSWLDLSIGRFKKGQKGIILPKDINYEYREHIKALIRKPGKDANGNPIATYLNVGDDHHGHARNYAEIALPLTVARTENKDISSFL